MNLDGRYPDCRNRIPQRNAGMGVGCGIDDNHIKLSLCLLDPTHQFAFLIGLAKINPYGLLRGPFAYFCLDIGQSGVAINLRLALSQQIQIRSVQEEDFHVRPAA